MDLDADNATDPSDCWGRVQAVAREITEFRRQRFAEGSAAENSHARADSLDAAMDAEALSVLCIEASMYNCFGLRELHEVFPCDLYPRCMHRS